MADSRSNKAPPSQLERKSNKKRLLEASTVPWIDAFELRTVGDALLSAADLSLHSNQSFSAAAEDEEEHHSGWHLSLEDALRRVDVWKTRTSLPASVESTAALSLALWREMGTSRTDEGQCLSTEYRLMYSSAIIRTINGLVDPFQQNRTIAGSVAQICTRIGVPLWLVDLRHDGTHNQLPSLALLRMGAVTLLRYLNSVYWEPLKRHREHCNQIIWGCLDDYFEAVDRMGHSQAPPRSKKATNQGASVSAPVPKAEAASTNGGYFDFGESSDEGDSENENLGGAAVSSTRIGTNLNMFSVLMNTKKSKKKKKESEDSQREEQPEQQEQQIHTNSLDTIEAPQKKKQASRPPEYFAQKLFKLRVPLDVAWESVLCHFLFGRARDDDSSLGCLVPYSIVEYPCTTGSVDKLRERLDPLLILIGKRWPGLIRALLIHIVDHVINIETQTENQEKQRLLYFLESWITYLVSQRFVASCQNALSSEPRREWLTPASFFDAILGFKYPLNALCDRLQDCDLIGVVSSVKKIDETFLTILGDKRTVKMGIHGKVIATPDASCGDAEASSVDHTSETTGLELGGSLSLAEMEAMLLETGKVPSPTETSSTQQRDSPIHTSSIIDRPVAWTKCTIWEPCAIGVLPGYPV